MTDSAIEDGLSSLQIDSRQVVSKIRDDLFIGNLAAAIDKELLQGYGFTHVVHLCPLPRTAGLLNVVDMRHYWTWRELCDSDEMIQMLMVLDVCELLKSLRYTSASASAANKIFIHDKDGSYIVTAVAVWHLLSQETPMKSFADIYTEVKAKHSTASLDEGWTHIIETSKF